jgi:hypothetical protein
MRDFGQEPGFVIGCLIRAIRFVALLISLVVWGIFGFLYWIPMLVFAIVRFSALVVYTSLSRADPSSLGLQLDRAVTFYVQGFSNIFLALNEDRLDHKSADPKIRWKVVIVSTIWTVLFWTAISIIVR